MIDKLFIVLVAIVVMAGLLGVVAGIGVPSSQLSTETVICPYCGKVFPHVRVEIPREDSK